jgi:hypothetical protein
MTRFSLSPVQVSVIEAPGDSRLFLSGPAGAGKTTAGVERLRWLLRKGVPGESILMLTPQRTLQEPYLDLLYSPERAAGGEATPATVGGLARRVVDLFWPLAADAAGFAQPGQPPVFLTLETAQYYMARLARPLLEQGYFESVTIDRNRLYSQILDNLNKSAAIGFPHTEIGARLDAAWYGDPAQRRVYADAQDCASRFRAYCLEHNLLDFSLQLEVFWEYLWPQETVRQYLTRTYLHLIYDNVEEDIPRAHDLLRDWLPEFESALLIYDEGGGYRKFLGADVDTAWALRNLCGQRMTLSGSFVMSAEIARLRENLAFAILPERGAPEGGAGEELGILETHFYPELLDTVADETLRLLDEGLPPDEIVILSPYLSDALRFSLVNRLEARGVPVRSHRPSRSLRDEPASQALLTLAALAHPYWGIQPPRFDAAYALMQAIAELDLVRAQLLTEIVYRPRDLSLSPFDIIKSDVQERITFTFGEQYNALRDWIMAYRESEPLTLDHFLRRLFGEVLSQPGYGFHSNFDLVRVAASLVESVRKFRQALEPADTDLGREYIAMLKDGVIAAQYLEGWRTEQAGTVLVSPAHTFLMMNRPASVQFWLDVGASGWTERLAQPLTHPHVLARGWEPGRLWSDADEVTANTGALARLTDGLLCRCRQRLYICLAELGESGFEQRGALVRAFQKMIHLR